MNQDRDRGEIHLGDLARALVTLPWQGQDQAAAIAACLGFGLGAPPAAPPSTTPHRVYDRRGSPIPPHAERPPARELPVFLPPTPPRPVPLPEETLPSQLTRLANLAPPHEDAPDWLAEAASAFPPDREGPRLARATLLPERTARHVVSAALAIQRPAGTIDLHRLIAAVCRREVLRELPRCLELTLQQGCQLLLDYSSRMVPWWDDLNDLAVQVRDVAGDQATLVFSFDTSPTQARHWTPAGEPRPWEPDGRPVLAATDLGIQGVALAEPNPDWTKLAARCSKAGSPLILLIPWPPERWPRSFPANATLVHWGRRTTAGMVRRQAQTLRDRR